MMTTADSLCRLGHCWHPLTAIGTYRCCHCGTPDLRAVVKMKENIPVTPDAAPAITTFYVHEVTERAVSHDYAELLAPATPDTPGPTQSPQDVSQHPEAP